MVNILNLESSTEVCSVALWSEGKLAAIMEDTEGMNHARLMASYIQEVMRKGNTDFKSLSAVAVSEGPGSYTGLRIGVSLAKGLCYAHQIPLIAVSPLQAMTDHIIASRKQLKLSDSENLIFCPMIDARRMEVYMAMYDHQNQEIESVGARIIEEDIFNELLENHTLVFFGNGSEKISTVVRHPKAVFIHGIKTSAQFMCKLSVKAYKNKQFADLAYFEPFYLKDFIAGISKKNRLMS